MTGQEFDGLTKQLGAETSRRGMLKGALAVALGGIAARFRGGVADAATARQTCARLRQSCATTPCCAGMICEYGACHRAPNASCYEDIDCSGGYTCRPTPHGLGQRCLPRGQQGDTCSDDADCASGLLCGTDTCAPGLSTLAAWEAHGSSFTPFGNPDSSTYGQVVTVPAGVSQLQDFGFELSVDVDAVFRGEVYAWDAVNAHATGPALWESLPRSSLLSGFNLVSFSTGGVPVVTGQQYVLFVSVSKDYAANAGVPTGTMGAVFDDIVPGGSFVFLNDTGDASKWTTAPWGVQTTYESAFRASFS